MIDKTFLQMAAHSTMRFVNEITSKSIHNRRETIGQRYEVEQGGKYEIFRDTFSEGPHEHTPTVLIVGFRLRIIQSNRILHWAFQRVCILTTPIWSGFPGFHVKLWMVDQKTKDYLGIYEWSTQDQARSYLNWLLNLLIPLSTSGSVWSDIRPGERLPDYLSDYSVRREMTIAPMQPKLWEDTGSESITLSN